MRKNRYGYLKILIALHIMTNNKKNNGNREEKPFLNKRFMIRL
jgi:hypothetical protein